jgi:sugar lactone lactonase YvrE
MERSSETRPSVIAPGGRLRKLAGGFDFTEGPTCNAQGDVFFTDQPNDRILKWSAERGLPTFLQPVPVTSNRLGLSPAPRSSARRRALPPRVARCECPRTAFLEDC